MAFAKSAEHQHTAHPVAVRSLGLTAFRSYETIRLDVGPDPVVLTGPNGAGKTNLLEALSYLSPGRGLRSARLADLGRRGDARPWAVSASIETLDGSIRSAPVPIPNR